MQRNIARAGAVAGGLSVLAAAVPAAAQSPITAALTPTPAWAKAAPAPHLELGARKLQARAGKPVIVKGHAVPGQVAKLQFRRDGRWSTQTTSRVSRDGAFRLVTKPAAALDAPARVLAGTKHRIAGRVKVYRSAFVSWYGPGLYGGHLACGGTLNAGTLGVANKYLPCGSKLTLRHGGRQISVTVVDRGPYVAGREYDLTAATAQKLGFSGTGTVLVSR